MKTTAAKYLIQSRTYYVAGRQIESFEVVNAKTGKLAGFAATLGMARVILSRKNAR